MRRRWPPHLLASRFWSNVEKTETCWLWTGAFFSRPEGDTARYGYGCFFDGARNRLAHRVAYELEHGLIPRGVVVRHTCDVRRCVRPSHLLSGMHEDNTADQVARRGLVRVAPQPSRQEALAFMGEPR